MSAFPRKHSRPVREAWAWPWVLAQGRELLRGVFLQQPPLPAQLALVLGSPLLLLGPEPPLQHLAPGPRVLARESPLCLRPLRQLVLGARPRVLVAESPRVELEPPLWELAPGQLLHPHSQGFPPQPLVPVQVLAAGLASQAVLGMRVQGSKLQTPRARYLSV